MDLCTGTLSDPPPEKMYVSCIPTPARAPIICPRLYMLNCIIRSCYNSFQSFLPFSSRILNEMVVNYETGCMFKKALEIYCIFLPKSSIIDNSKLIIQSNSILENLLLYKNNILLVKKYQFLIICKMHTYM